MEPFAAVIFDLDGVLTDTAEYHYQAWKRLADEEGLPFSREVNEALRGVSRRRSLEIILGGRQVPEERMQEMMARKNRYYREALTRLQPRDLLPGAVEIVQELRAAGIKVAIGSASKNARTVIERLGLADQVDLVADGYSASRTKPAPDLFLYAAIRLGLPPEHCVVVEDAAAGIDAALNAGMWAVGLGPEERVGHAHVYFPSLEGVTLDTLRQAIARARAEAELWTVQELQLDPARLPAQEAVFTVGNGYLGTRGTFEEGYGNREPVTLVHGLWDDAPIVYTELVNAPDWTGVQVTVTGEPLRLDRGTVLAYRRDLNLREGVLRRYVRWQSPAGDIVDVRWERFAAFHDPHLLGQRVWVTPVSGPVTVEVRGVLSGHVHNAGFVHWYRVREGSGWLQLRTRHTDRHLVVGSVMMPWDRELGNRSTCALPGQCGETVTFHLQPGQVGGVDRLIALYTDRDLPEGVATPREAVRLALERAQARGYDEMLAQHRAAWRQTWEVADIVIEGDVQAQRAVRFSTYHLLIAGPRHSDRVSIGGKTLSGLGYRGHAFWDTEIFMLPFFIYTRPQIARNLLMYRHHTLPAARRKAHRNGYAGAQYAWESAETGDEVTPRWVPGPDGELVRIWCGDIELHISADVAYGIWHYWQVTGDDAFMRDFGAEIVLETARFWESCVEEEPDGFYHLRDVIGPDEYHEHVDDNAYTNGLVRWHLRWAEEVFAWLEAHDPERACELARRLEITPDRLKHWQDIARRLRFLQDPHTGLIEQFEGFFRLRDVDLAALEPRTRSVQALLGIEETNRVQVLKQPDVLMLLTLLRDEFPREVKEVNWEYYTPRTDHTHGSSLGPAIHAWMACELGRLDEAYAHFRRALLVDLEDLRGNTADGIHGAAAGGVWQAVVFGFAGLRVTPEGWSVTPRLPAGWRRVRFKFYHRGTLHTVEVEASAENLSPSSPSAPRSFTTGSGIGA